jgi:hypothetical protein
LKYRKAANWAASCLRQEFKEISDGPDKKNKGTDLISILQHGDADVELDFMMAKGSNSGVYLQGRYEIQLLDSWGVLNPGPGDVGGVYQRWDESRPEGKKGFEGNAPRQNVGRAPGLWQHLKISFQAPRFIVGHKIENARMLKVELNGVTIQENVELTGPTRSSMASDEVALGPLLLQGDHGAVAYRNIRITSYNKPRPDLVGLKYTVYKGNYEPSPITENFPLRQQVLPIYYPPTSAAWKTNFRFVIQAFCKYMNQENISST